MSYKITDHTESISNDTQIKASQFLRHMADEIVTIATPKTPKKTGRLRMDILRQVLGLNGKVVWGKGYAAKMETQQFKHYTTPGTSAHFAKNAVKDAIKLTSKVAKLVGLS